MIADDPHVVRWAIRPLKRAFDIQWTKWHWTSGDGFTLCGRAIVVGRDDVPMFPETDERRERVDCSVCKAGMNREATP